MGYFNYFIKCIIRNITYKLCKPKVFFTVLLCVLLLFVLHSKGYCTESSEVIVVTPTDQLGNGYVQYDNQYLTLREFQESAQVEAVMKLYSLYSTRPAETKAFLQKLFTELEGGTTSGNRNIYVQKATSGHQFTISVYFTDGLTHNSSMGSYTTDSGGITFVNVPYSQNTFWSYFINTDNTLPTQSEGQSLNVPTPFLGVFVPEWIQLFKDVGIISSNSTVLDELVEQNQLQQEQNQIQQEQNNFLKQETSDEDVSIDNFSNVDSNDVTSAGLTGIFNSIYNSISSWSSKDIVLPVPFTQKSIKIQANYTSNMLNSVGGQVLINIVSTIYYFIVARFIIYSITGIINSIKSGSILNTDTKTNITTDML